jgi:hypothetical protein
VLEGDDFTSGTDGHARLPFAKRGRPRSPGSSMRRSCDNSHRYLGRVTNGSWGASPRVLAAAGAKRFNARYSQNRGVPSVITALAVATNR